MVLPTPLTARVILSFSSATSRVQGRMKTCYVKNQAFWIAGAVNNVDSLMLRDRNWTMALISCDLTPLDYFLWGYVKSFVYADKPQTLDHLEDNIRRVIADIRPQMLEKVIENWTSRLDNIRASRGSPMPKIIFKM
ncbi:hypothetical protein TNCV_2011111 [Trichonephila clavipes]|nr:hypothetical protein TNCV_2011111 [Trichonephila clavipes]